MSSGSADETHAAHDLTSTVYMHSRTHLTLAQPRDVVWSAFRDMRTWYTEYTWEVISGPSYEQGMGFAEGQIMKISIANPLPRADGMNPPAAGYVAEVLVDEPNRIIVAATGEEAEYYERATSFYSFSIDESDEGTTVAVESLSVAYLQTPLDPGELAEYKQALAAGWHHSWDTALENLRRQLGDEDAR